MKFLPAIRHYSSLLLIVLALSGCGKNNLSVSEKKPPSSAWPANVRTEPEQAALDRVRGANLALSEMQTSILSTIFTADAVFIEPGDEERHPIMEKLDGEALKSMAEGGRLHFREDSLVVPKETQASSTAYFTVEMRVGSSVNDRDLPLLEPCYVKFGCNLTKSDNDWKVSQVAVVDNVPDRSFAVEIDKFITALHRGDRSAMVNAVDDDTNIIQDSKSSLLRDARKAFDKFVASIQSETEELTPKHLFARALARTETSGQVAFIGEILIVFEMKAGKLRIVTLSLPQ